MQPLSLSFFERRRKGSGCTYYLKSGVSSPARIIREGSVSKIVSLIESGGGEGMQKMDDAILKRYQDSEITGDTAYLFATQKQRFEHLQGKTKD